MQNNKKLLILALDLLKTKNGPQTARLGSKLIDVTNKKSFKMDTYVHLSL